MYNILFTLIQNSKRLLLLSMIIWWFTSATDNARLALTNNNYIKGDEGHSEREGRWIHYFWNYTNGEIIIPFELELHLGYEFADMQNTYKKLNHEHIYSPKVRKDPYKNVIQVVADVLKEKAEKAGIEAALLALSFVQALPYQDNMEYYQRYASECLIDCRGDCSDCSVLYAAILDAMDIDCIFLEYPKHLMVGVGSTARSGTYYTHRGRYFYMCETTGWGWQIGENSDAYDYATLIDL